MSAGATWTKRRRQAERRYAREAGFKMGVCVALAVVAAADQEGLWREIVRESGVGHRALRRHSKQCGNLAIDGFLKYREARPPRRRPDHDDC